VQSLRSKMRERRVWLCFLVLLQTLTKSNCTDDEEPELVIEEDISQVTREIVKDTTKDALSVFLSTEKLYNTVELNKWFYKKWTPEGDKVSESARLLDIALETLENTTSDTGAGDYSDYSYFGNDYLSSRDVLELKNVSKVSKIKLILQELELLSKEAGSDYSFHDYNYSYENDDEDQESEATASSCRRYDTLQCDSFARYRSATGECNNLFNVEWGRINRPQKRLYEATYEDGIGALKRTEEYEKRKRITLPNPRLLSKNLHQNKAKRKKRSRLATHLLMQFGQFLDHDITLTPEPELECCSERLKHTRRCESIQMDWTNFLDVSKDPILMESLPAKSQTCISFSRSDPACNTGIGVREQLNSITAFVDGSNVYGSSERATKLLRIKKIKSDNYGQLEVNHGNNRDLPTRKQVGISDDKHPGETNFKVAGDNRCVEHPGLISMHTIWMNEHNRIASLLLKEKSIEEYMTSENMTNEDKDEFIFQETRRLVGAELQRVTYAEFLPVVIGPAMMESYGLNLPDTGTKYDPEEDPTILNEFSTVSFRFGHTLVSETFPQLRSRSGVDPDKEAEGHNLKLGQNFFNPASHECENSTCIGDEDYKCVNSTCSDWHENMLYGLMTSRSMRDDMFLNDAISNLLFLSKEKSDMETGQRNHAESSDLAARNIQRGRDHGLPNYDTFRKTNKRFPLKPLADFGLEPCTPCLRELRNDGDLFCHPYLVPDRECEDCTDYRSFDSFHNEIKESTARRCYSCVKRKCPDDCVADSPRDIATCRKCFANQIIAIHSYTDPAFRANKFVDEKISCRKCMEQRRKQVKQMSKDGLGIKEKDFIRIGEAYCWSLQSIDAFTGSLAEISLEGGLQGPTNTAIIAEQFRRLLYGDRFFYTHGFLNRPHLERGLEPIIREAINRQSMASVLCNNFQEKKDADKSKIRMRTRPFEAKSRWQNCARITRRAEIDFNIVAEEIVKRKKLNDDRCAIDVSRANCEYPECKTDRDCQKKYDDGDYICYEQHCEVKKIQCLEVLDCQVGESCSKDGLCQKLETATCEQLNCTQPWLQCRSHRQSELYCTCRYNELEVYPNCKTKTPDWSTTGTKRPGRRLRRN